MKRTGVMKLFAVVAVAGAGCQQDPREVGAGRAATPTVATPTTVTPIAAPGMTAAQPRMLREGSPAPGNVARRAPPTEEQLRTNRALTRPAPAPPAPPAPPAAAPRPAVLRHRLAPVHARQPTAADAKIIAMDAVKIDAIVAIEPRLLANHRPAPGNVGGKRGGSSMRRWDEPDLDADLAALDRSDHSAVERAIAINAALPDAETEWHPPSWLEIERRVDPDRVAPRAPNKTGVVTSALGVQPVAPVERAVATTDLRLAPTEPRVLANGHPACGNVMIGKGGDDPTDCGGSL